MVAAENGALPGGKVGGIGDVIRDLPVALAKRGWQATVITPSYGVFSQLPQAVRLGEITVPFGGQNHSADIWQIPATHQHVSQLVIEHPLLSPRGPGQIYCGDSSDRPFATDASKFAFFCAAVATWAALPCNRPAVVHLHDWHAAFLLWLRDTADWCKPLREIRTVYTIHNLAYQGIRPLQGDESSLKAWFPDLPVTTATVGDPRYPDCINPMAMAIRLADSVNTVSPSYAREICLPANPAHGFGGGEGLEQDLQRAANAGRLNGILNGCEYPQRTLRRGGWEKLRQAIRNKLQTWQSTATHPLHLLAQQRLGSWPHRRPRHVLTSVGRLSTQKIALLFQPTGNGLLALDRILGEILQDGVLIMLGSGDPALEQRLGDMAARHSNLLYLGGFSESLADHLYSAGDLFLMPSSFEPCGISQLLAMRAGQPCLVHGVGGLRDTVADGETGFVFNGDTPCAQADDLVTTLQRALQLRESHPERWKALRARAAAARFTWDAAAAVYENTVYGYPAGRQ